MNANITVEGRALGSKRPLFPEFSFDLPIPGDDSFKLITLRTLIESVVEIEVRAFEERREANKFVRALTEKDIEQGLMRGKVDSGGRDLEQTVNPEQAKVTAIQAFEDGIYYVFIDDVQHTELDTPFALRSAARMMFLRLVPLAGG